ncbi:MAG: DHHW family protein [Lachnospiraceae bacterium]|nr:DHHW family protein [Lachnospiraceae bacterium]MCI7243524.1 DHHW family protein [Lachnobacterium sp.]
MKKVRIIIIIVFIGFFVLISGASLIIKDREFSPNENRYLAETPELSWDNILSGKFQDGLEDYLRDQVCFRDGWITVKTGIQKACGDTDIGGAYVGKDGYDFEKITPEDVDEKQVDRNIKAVEDYFMTASETIDKQKLSFLLVPTSGLVMQEKLPKNARLFDQAKYIDQVQKAMKDYNFVDVRDTLMDHNEEYIYYKTDHHWTSAGACLAYEVWSEHTGGEAEKKDELAENVVSDKFRGSLYSKILDADSAYDEIWTYGLQKDDAFGSKDCTVMIDEKQQLDSIYDDEKLQEKDKYAYFLGGNYGQVHIQNQKAASKAKGKNILIIKDSFANSFVPFVTQDYENIYMVDLRYYNGDMKAYLQEHEITDVLVLYNISNFISDRNLHKLTGGI